MNCLGLRSDVFFSKYNSTIKSNRLVEMTVDHEKKIKELQERMVGVFTSVGEEGEDWEISYDFDESKHVCGIIYSKACLRESLLNEPFAK